MTIADKVGLLKQDFDEVYDAGYEKGKSEGGGGSDDGVLASLIDRSITEITIPEGITRIGSGAFTGCSALTGSVTIPEGVKRIEMRAFDGCSNITELEFPDTLEYIGGTCFSNTIALKRLITPHRVFRIEASVAMNSGISEFVAKGNLTFVGNGSFSGCSACLSYDFTNCTNVPQLANINAFTGINGKAKILVPASLYDEWIVATNWAEYADYIEPYYTVSEGLEYETDNYGNKYVIGRGSCTDSVIVIPDGITAIAGGAFANDTLIDTLILPESGVTIEYSVSDDLGGVQGSSLRKIVNYYNAIGFAFSGLSLEYISFVETPRAINGLVFMSIQGSPVYDFSKCTAVVQISGDVEYMSVGEETQIIVPASLYDEWIADTNWAYYADYIVAAE